MSSIDRVSEVSDLDLNELQQESITQKPSKRTPKSPSDTNSLKNKVQPLSDVREESLETLKTLSIIRNSEKKVDEVLRVWTDQMESERKLRETTAIYIYCLLAFELVLSNVILISLGFNWIKIEKWIADVFFVGVFGNIIAIAMVVVKNLFPVPKKDLQSAVVEMVDKM